MKSGVWWIFDFMPNIPIFIIRQLECSLQMQYLQKIFTTPRLSPIISGITYLAFWQFDKIARKNAAFSKATMSFLHNNYYMHIEHDNHSFFA